MDNMTNNTGNTDVSITGASIAPRAAVPPATTPASGKTRVAINFMLKDTDALLIVDSERILVSMTDNPAYPAPDPRLADLITARNAFIAAVSAAKDSTIALSARRAQRTVLTDLLRKLAHYVQTASNGDRTTLLSSGFPAQRTRAPVGKLQAPTGLTVARSKLSGQIIVRCNRHPKAGAYHWRIGPTATPMVWLPIDTTLAAHIAYDNLVMYTAYTAQVRAIGTAGPSDWSDVASAVVV
jgi:hypothetical protein